MSRDDDYDVYDMLVDTDPLTLRDRCRAAEGALRELLAACDEYENSGYSGSFHEAKMRARSVVEAAR